MGKDRTIDARMQAALARLTDNEKECLRRRLRQQTAKEMALELGVSPHAVEKRLKMARAKLGLSSSLEAARLLVASEGYNHLGPQPPDLVAGLRARQFPAPRFWLAGGMVMGVFVLAALALAWQSSTGADAVAGQGNVPTADQVAAVATENFRAMDRDGSGFLEPDEFPAPPEAGQAAVAASDGDGDGRLSPVEYRAWAARIVSEQRQVTGGQRTRGAMPPGHVAPSEAEIVHMTQTTFHHVDADNSGYIDGLESPIAPPKGPQPVYRRDGDGNVVATGETVVHDENEIRAEFYRRADKDGDGRISYPEFHHWSAPNLVRNGIPAKWREDIRRWMSTGG